MKLRPAESFIKKMREVYEMFPICNGFMIVGIPLPGKTASHRVLAAALGILAEQDEPEQYKVGHHPCLNLKSVPTELAFFSAQCMRLELPLRFHAAQLGSGPQRSQHASIDATIVVE